MGDLAIRVEGLGKRYTIGERQGFARWLMTRAGRAANGLRGDATVEETGRKTIWAVRDVSFEIRRGEVVGVVGRNGAGKSTLLKLLCRIVRPDTGSAEIHGRVGSLLEVGTGFHPELTGRDNVFLNGAILGMKKPEIVRKFDEIVAFAGVEKFIDTPVKHYSSGMYVRLAFAVAAHLEPDVLLVDEVLAVGDASFQKKCLDRIGEVSGKGRTVLFVSHNMASVSQLCERTLWIEGGRLRSDGRTEQVLADYVSSSMARRAITLGDRTDRQGNGAMRLVDLQLLNKNGQSVDAVASGDDVRLALRYRAAELAPLDNVKIAIAVYTIIGNFLFYCSNELAGGIFRRLPPEGVVTCTLPRLPLSPGEYSCNVSCLVNDVMADWVLDAGIIRVIRGDFFGTGQLPPASHGGLLAEQHWHAVSDRAQT